MTPLGSGVETLFVGMAWDGGVLEREHHEFWERLVRVYPRVREVVRE